MIKGYSKYYEEINCRPLPKQHLNKIKLLFDQRIGRRSAKYNLTKEEEGQWEPSNKIIDNNELSNTNNESKEYDWEKINIHTTSECKDEDKDYSDKYLHIGKKVDMKRVEESLPLGVRIRMRLREKGELLKKKYSCVIVLLRLKISAPK